MTSLARAYSVTGAAAWQGGPGLVYDPVAEAVVARSPTSLRGARVLDVGAGAGAATRAALAAGAGSVVAVDAALGMLDQAVATRRATVGDAVALPFGARSFDACVAAFSLNHLTDPAVGLREMARVTRPGGGLLASAYAADDSHPVKAAVRAALEDRGWIPEPWFRRMTTDAAPLLATPAGFAAAAAEAHLDAAVDRVSVPLPGLGPHELVRWRLGLAHHAPFVARLSVAGRADLLADALQRLGDRPPPLVRSVLVLRAVNR